MKVDAAVMRECFAPLSLEKLDIGEPTDAEVLVRVVATGVCHTDIAMRDQRIPLPRPIVLGHEGAGVVQRVGRGVTKVRPGDHVVMTFNSCGHCDSCREHQPAYCHNFHAANFASCRMDGSCSLSHGQTTVHSHFFGQSSFATHAICTERNVVKVDSDLPLELLGPLGCGFQTGAGAVINTFRPRAGQSLLVMGAGAVGLAAVMAARAIGVTTIIAVDVVDERLVLARELGATHVINSRVQTDVVAGVTSIAGAGVNFSLETTGLESVLSQAIGALAPRGTCGFVASAGTPFPVNVRDMMINGKSLRGIIEGDADPDVFIPALISLYRRGDFPIDRLIRFYRLDQVNEAIVDSESGKVIKPVLRMPVADTKE